MSKTHTFMGFLAHTGYTGATHTREKYSADNADAPPFLLSIRGPTGSKAANKVDTLASGSNPAGKSNVFGVLQMRVWEIDKGLFMTSIGRANGQHVQVANDEVSKHHASILRRTTDNNWVVSAETHKNTTAVVKYGGSLCDDDITKEVRTIVPPGEQAVLEDRLVIELAGRDHGTRLAWFTDYGSFYDLYTQMMQKSA